MASNAKRRRHRSVRVGVVVAVAVETEATEGARGTATAIGVAAASEEIVREEEEGVDEIAETKAEVEAGTETGLHDVARRLLGSFFFFFFFFFVGCFSCLFLFRLCCVGCCFSCLFFFGCAVLVAV